MLRRIRATSAAVLMLVLVSAAYAFHGNRAVAPSLFGTHPSTLVRMSTFQDASSTYAVLRVVDGDTLDVMVDTEKVRIRLIGINTPEVVDPRKPVECFGREASTKAKDILSGQRVRVETDSSQGLYDKYGRVLAYVYLSDGTLFNELMVREGYAHEYTFRIPYKYQGQFKYAEQDARNNGRGLWAVGVCVK